MADWKLNRTDERWEILFQRTQWREEANGWWKTLELTEGSEESAYYSRESGSSTPWVPLVDMWQSVACATAEREVREEACGAASEDSDQLEAMFRSRYATAVTRIVGSNAIPSADSSAAVMRLGFRRIEPRLQKAIREAPALSDVFRRSFTVLQAAVLVSEGDEFQSYDRALAAEGRTKLKRLVTALPM